MSQNNNKPIGVFDSGVGGLTVLKELVSTFPNEDFIYIGDTARVPYGTKSEQEIVKAAGENIEFLIKQGVKAVVVACNSASSVALPVVKDKYQIPVLGVVEAGCCAAVETSRSKIAVIGTRATISSDAYKLQLLNLNEDLKIIQKSCPLFVPLVEEAWLNNDITKAVAEEYLGPISADAEVIILGCTHYPLLKAVIASVLPEALLIDSAAAVASQTLRKLQQNDLFTESNSTGMVKIFLTDDAPNFYDMARMILGENIPEPEVIDVYS